MSRQQSYREMNQNQPQRPSGYTLSPGVRNFLLFTLGWSALSHLAMIAGIWDYEGVNSTFDVVMSCINIFIPIGGIVFISLLYDAATNS